MSALSAGIMATSGVWGSTTMDRESEGIAATADYSTAPGEEVESEEEEMEVEEVSAGSAGSGGDPNHRALSPTASVQGGGLEAGQDICMYHPDALSWANTWGPTPFPPLPNLPCPNQEELLARMPWRWLETRQLIQTRITTTLLLAWVPVIAGESTSERRLRMRDCLLARWILKALSGHDWQCLAGHQEEDALEQWWWRHLQRLNLMPSFPATRQGWVALLDTVVALPGAPTPSNGRLATKNCNCRYLLEQGVKFTSMLHWQVPPEFWSPSPSVDVPAENYLARYLAKRWAKLQGGGITGPWGGYPDRRGWGDHLTAFDRRTYTPPPPSPDRDSADSAGSLGANRVIPLPDCFPSWHLTADDDSLWDTPNWMDLVHCWQSGIPLSEFQLAIDCDLWPEWLCALRVDPCCRLRPWGEAPAEDEGHIEELGVEVLGVAGEVPQG